MESDRRGIESHGYNRFKLIYVDRIIDGIQNPVTEFEIIKESPTTAVVDGHDAWVWLLHLNQLGAIGEEPGGYKGYGCYSSRNIICCIAGR